MRGTITEDNFIRMLEMSGDDIPKSMSADMKKWIRMQKDLSDARKWLIAFLSSNIVDVYFKTRDGSRRRAIVTANRAFYENSRTSARTPSAPVDIRYVMAFDILKNRPCSIQVLGCEIGRYVALKAENAKLISVTVSKILSMARSRNGIDGRTTSKNDKR